MDKTSGKNRAFLDRLFEAFVESTSYSDEAVRESLADEAVDQAQIVSRGLQLVRLQLDQQRLIGARARMEAMRHAIHTSRSMADRGNDNVRLVIAETIVGARGDALVSAYFRKLESVEGEDLRSLVDDADILDIFDKMEAGAK